MKLVILRILFGAAFVYVMNTIWEINAQGPQPAGDLSSAFYLAAAVILALLNAVVWTPYLAGRFSDPLTAPFTHGTTVDPKNRWIRLIARLEQRGHRRLTLLGCFLEGIRHPSQPTAFVIGLHHARQGSWLEKVFAREVFRFNNIQHCVEAFRTLQRHGIDPRPHPNPEVNLALHSLDKPAKEDPEKIDVPPAPKVSGLKRNPRIRLFD